jgi:PAS domain S-box-containing protein
MIEMPRSKPAHGRRHTVPPSRFFVECVVIVAVLEAAVLLPLRVIMGSQVSNSFILMHAAILMLAGMPMLLWRLSAMARAERVVREQADRLDLTITSANLGTWDWDIVSGHVYFNRTAQTMLGYEEGEWEPHVNQWERPVCPEDLPSVRTGVRAHLDGATPEYRAEFRMRRKDGTWSWILGTGRVTERDAQGVAVRAMGVHVDITAQKHVAEARRIAQEAAESANKAKSEFLANMSHEIRTPMTAILGYADLFEEQDLTLQPRQRLEYIDTIRRNGEHLMSIINDVLDLSKIEVGKMKVESISMRPLDVVHEVVELMQVKASGKGLALSVVQEMAIPEAIISDPIRLRQILINLVGNAIKFTEVGGVTIGVQCVLQPVGGGLMSFSVKDTGIGMTQSQIERLFQAFHQADHSTTRRFGGTGLGLRICKNLSQLLGGEVAVTSAVGCGSTFTVTIATGPLEGVAMVSPDTLSAAATPVPTRRVASTMSAKELAGVRIALVDDGPDNQRLIAFHLKRAGAEVSVFDNGKTALEAMTADGTIDGELRLQPAFDVVVTDLQMPEMDGLTLVRLLRAKGWTRSIVALTAHAMIEDAARCRAAGCDLYASKPIDRDVLIAVCKEAAGQSAVKVAA